MAFHLLHLKRKRDMTTLPPSWYVINRRLCLKKSSNSRSWQDGGSLTSPSTDIKDWCLDKKLKTFPRRCPGSCVASLGFSSLRTDSALILITRPNHGWETLPT